MISTSAEKHLIVRIIQRNLVLFFIEGGSYFRSLIKKVCKEYRTLSFFLIF
jgi:hypothetical protein